jgi:hypothetical protein
MEELLSFNTDDNIIKKPITSLKKTFEKNPYDIKWTTIWYTYTVIALSSIK